MAASVDNRPFTIHQHAVVRSYKPAPELPHPIKLPLPPPLSDSSSDDEEETTVLKELILKSSVEVESSVFDPRDDGTSDHWSAHVLHHEAAGPRLSHPRVPCHTCLRWEQAQGTEHGETEHRLPLGARRHIYFGVARYTVAGPVEAVRDLQPREGSLSRVLRRLRGSAS
ncbi:hypothetical protein V8G54_008001 [Vigna mungo]|uniref:Uncharacterized protein n=1 Tax=Vigna mungo TaxID=3915 RepID=A0AAQ3S600_VIGMU